jgi:hypothetical protein
MEPDDLREIMDFLRGTVSLEEGGRGDRIVIRFDAPTLDAMTEAGLHREGSGRILAAPWWDEMVDDIVETPEMCDSDDSPEQVLAYARDVVSEYIRKRATP